MRQPTHLDERVYTLTISGGDMMRAKLYDFDRLLLRDCDSPDATVADKLLGLALLARRIEEASTTDDAPASSPASSSPGSAVSVSEGATR